MKFLERLFFRRPRVLNALNWMNLANATSQTNEFELDALARYARGAQNAVEIGSYQGVSAARISAVMGSDGVLFCVDPWLGEKGGDDPNFEIFQRHLHRCRVWLKVRIVRGFSGTVASQLPENIDFAFIDGDHSWKGLETDWNLIAPRVVRKGVVCLHDTVRLSEEWRNFESIRFFDEKIATDVGFELMETVHSMRIVRKV